MYAIVAMFQALFSRFNRWVAKISFTSGARIDFYRALLLLLRNHVLLNKSLFELHKVYSVNGKRPNDPIAVVITACLEKMDEGHSFGESLRDWIPFQESTLLIAGEGAGQLEGAFISAERLIKARGQITGSILGALLYPALLFSLTGFLLHMVATDLVPSLSQVVPPSQWHGSALTLYYLAIFVNNYGLYTVLLLVGGLSFCFMSLAWLGGPIRILLDKIPPWSLYRMIEGATFLLNVSALISSGQQLNTALELLSSEAGPWLKTRIEAARNQLAEGKNFGEALVDSGYGFPDDKANRFLSVIASYRGIGPAMDDFAQSWLATTVKRVEMISGLLLMCGTGAVGAIMLLVVAGAGGFQDVVQNAAAHQL